MKQELLNELNLGEDHERECKLQQETPGEYMGNIFFLCQYQWWNNSLGNKRA